MDPMICLDRVYIGDGKDPEPKGSLTIVAWDNRKIYGTLLEGSWAAKNFGWRISLCRFGAKCGGK